jgi:hypothetical protein
MKTFGWLFILSGLILILCGPSALRAEILNNDEYGAIEIKDFSVIENAANIFTPVGLSFNVPRGGPLYPGNDITIKYRGLNGTYATLLDYSPDPVREVKPLVMNEQIKMNDGGLEGSYTGTVADTLGSEFIMLIISALPLDDSKIEEIALAPDEVKIDKDILLVAVNDFEVVKAYNTPDRSIEPRNIAPVEQTDAGGISLYDFGTVLDNPLNNYPYDPWGYMYLYPYARFRPSVYMNQFGPLTQTWYVFPNQNTFQSNFWDYASDGWIDDGIWIIPPGGYWEGSLNVDDPYTAYYLRILPYLARMNTSYERYLTIEINGTLVQSNFDFSGSIGYGDYQTNNPFAYYNLNTLLHRGTNRIRIYWPEDQQDNLELQMVDVAPATTVETEITQAQTAVQQANENPQSNLSQNSDEEDSGTETTH